MMKNSSGHGSYFLDRLARAEISKDEIFEALFDARGYGPDINTRHVFFQEVIIKFNASKAKAVIKNHLPYETDSHYVDMALWRYIEVGGDLKSFDKDLEIAKENYAKTHQFIHRLAAAQNLRAGA
ncbi:MAG: hypothetical protein IJ482_03000 [Alphaproteobacteria bacterium]|nr:hypothetical protein [Alphaproteobacteria bacterium]